MNQDGIAKEAVEKPYYVLLVNLGRGKGRFLCAWLLDLGCTHHMFPRWKWFSTYKPFEEGTFLMGNNVTCKTIGIGNILIGSKKCIFIITFTIIFSYLFFFHCLMCAGLE